jgi:hypothetical protein
VAPGIAPPFVRVVNLLQIIVYDGSAVRGGNQIVVAANCLPQILHKLLVNRSGIARRKAVELVSETSEHVVHVFARRAPTSLAGSAHCRSRQGF